MKTEKRGRTIVVADDEAEIRDFLEMTLRCQGYEVELARDGNEVLDCLQAKPSISAVLMDVFMPGKDGLDTILEIRSKDTDLPILMFSGDFSPENIVAAMKRGATDFLGKPVGHQEVLTALENALARRRTESKELEFADQDHPSGLSNPQMRELYATAASVAPSDAPILILGETGVGKEVLARHLHSLSLRAQKPFIKLNCAALPSELVESELFGYERGAFTGAYQRKPGMFEIAHGGTLLLDEIGDMDFKLQAKLLQVLQDHEFQRLGGKETIRVDVRVIAATHNDLEKSIASGKFRQDLYYRLNVVTLNVPSLRERKEDIMRLTKLLMEKHASVDLDPPPVTPALLQALLTHDWPGNVRELENVVRKLIVLRDPDMIARDLAAHAARKTLADAPNLMEGASKPALVEISTPILQQVNRAKDQAEMEAILAGLNSTHWNRKKAAALLKIDYKALLYKMKKLGIEDKLAVMPPGDGATRDRGESLTVGAG